MSLLCVGSRKGRSKSVHDIGSESGRIRKRDIAAAFLGFGKIPSPREQQPQQSSSACPLVGFLDHGQSEDSDTKPNRGRRRSSESGRRRSLSLSDLGVHDLSRFLDNSAAGERWDAPDRQKRQGSSDRQSSSSSSASLGEDEEEQKRERRMSSSRSLPAHLSSPNCREGRRQSWQEFAGRTNGDEGYQIGDLTRGIAHQVVMTIVGTAITLEDMEPISATGEACEKTKTKGSGLPFIGRSARRASLPLSFVRGLGMPEESILGEGQYGVVWRARSRTTKKVYAVKTIKSQPKDEALASREIEVAKFIRQEPHPCLVGLLAVFEAKEADLNCWSLVMEFCPGGDLQLKISDARSLALKEDRPYSPPAQAHRWLAQIFLGLEHVHLQIELLFRDLKPGNIVFNDSDCAKLTDFGLSRRGLESSGAWTFGFPAGSPGYTAPEITEQEQYDHRADLYSFGVLIWVVLTGGVTDRDEPMPPMNAIEDEWELLVLCLDDPENNSARALQEPALDLVRKLTGREPTARLEHEGIRAHKFLEPQAMPPPIGRLGDVAQRSSGSTQSLLSPNASGASVVGGNDAAREVVCDWLQQGVQTESFTSRRRSC